MSTWLDTIKLCYLDDLHAMFDIGFLLCVQKNLVIKDVLTEYHAESVYAQV